MITSCETSSTTLSEASDNGVEANIGVMSGRTTLLSISIADAAEGAGIGEIFLRMPE